ncbi:MAG: hypothetical protein ACLFNQ_06570 [Spirochaetaceae bacterium]
MSDTQRRDPHRERLEILLDSGPLGAYLARAGVIEADPSEPLVAEYHALHAAGELDAEATFEDFWRAARLNGRPVSAGVERLVGDSVRARAAADLTEAWPQVPAAERERVALVRDALLDPSVTSVFLGLFHAPLVASLKAASEVRAQQMDRDDGNYVALSAALRTRMAGRDGFGGSDPEAADASAPLAGTLEARALSEPIPSAPTALAEAEYLSVRAVLTNEGEAWAALKHGGAAAEAWIMRSIESAYVLDERMIRCVDVLLSLNPARALRIAGGLFRTDEAAGGADSTSTPRAELYRALLDMVLARSEAEVLPLLIFIMEPQGKLRADRETAASLRALIRESGWFRKVRRMLRRLQAGEPVLVPAGVDFEGFVRSELSRLGYTEGTPDPEVLTAIRTRWLHAMHEDLLYHSPADIPEVSFAEALGEAGESERNPGDIVTDRTTDDPDWILKPADGDPEGKPRIVRAYDAQSAVYEAAGLGRVQQRQLDMTVRDLVMRAARSWNENERERAVLLMSAARGLSADHPAVAALSELVSTT